MLTSLLAELTRPKFIGRGRGFTGSGQVPLNSPDPTVPRKSQIASRTMPPNPDRFSPGFQRSTPGYPKTVHDSCFPAVHAREGGNHHFAPDYRLPPPRMPAIAIIATPFVYGGGWTSINSTASNRFNDEIGCKKVPPVGPS
jgi:hypothetical protein